MIRSMTGYGGAKESLSGFEISVEVKSVNNRYLETNVRIPRTYMFAEDAVKSAVQRHISRGKVDVFISIDAVETDDVAVKINRPLLEGYMAAVKEIAETQGLPNDMTALNAARLPDVLAVEKKDADTEALTELIVSVLEKALNDFDRMREKEGAKLRNDVLGRLETIGSLVTKIENAAPETVKAYEKRLQEKIEAILGADYDKTRIIQEVAIYADHIAVDEETVRLRSHMEQLNGMLNGMSPIGKKMDFLIQEFNREANTTGSKCQNSDIAHTVVDLKSEIEKIREQIQNIE